MRRLRTVFRDFRYTRPFWGGLWVLLSGALIGWLPLGPVADIVSAGSNAFAGVFIGIALIAMGLVIVALPGHHKLAALSAVVLGLVSFPVTNLGGFIAGMVLAVFGGCMALAWTPDKPRRRAAPDRSEGIAA